MSARAKRGWAAPGEEHWKRKAAGVKITVCANCKRACCWQGEFYCDQFKTAGTVEITFEEALALGLEHTDWLLRDENMKHVLLHGE